MQDTGSNGIVAAGSSAFRYGIAKISNFARIAKISISLSLVNFC